jgi:adenine-specific DNA-methyltransferase
MASSALQKSLGAFYTDEHAANRLVKWAIRDSNATVLDPSCGDGVFLAAAAARLSSLGAGVPKVYGVDVASEALRTARVRAQTADLVESDFFDITPCSFPAFDAVVGNPPFIRYQTFNGDLTGKGHLRAREAGVRLPRLASSWAPYVVHAVRFLRPGGRLAMVMPTELGHAMYAREVLRHLVEHFRHVRVEMFRDKMFGELSQSTVLLLCEGYGEFCRSFDVATSDALLSDRRQVAPVNIDSVRSGKFRLTRYLVPEVVRDLYDALAGHNRVRRLKEVADVGIGYVSGANDFFHLSDCERQQLGVDGEFLRPAAMNLRGIEGFVYRREYWSVKRKAGEKVHLLALPALPKEELPTSIRQYLHRGESEGVAERYKCRIRKFWYAVPHVRVADAFLSYMSDEMPSLVTNPASLVAPNTIHLVRFHNGRDSTPYASAWKNSLTRLSCELEGHALGGGLLKLEPSEAENVLAIAPNLSQQRKLAGDGPHKGSLALSPNQMDTADRLLLREEIGLSTTECLALREAAVRIQQWRKHQ